jgi:hypothetical protein
METPETADRFQECGIMGFDISDLIFEIAHRDTGFQPVPAS